MSVLIVIVAMLVLFIPQIALHEGSHAFMGKRYGLLVDEFRFWPGMVDGKLKMGYVRFESSSIVLPGEQRAHIAIAPMVLTSTLFIVAIVAVQVVPGWPAYLLLALALNNAIDGTYNSGRLAFMAQHEDLTRNNDTLKWVRYETLGLPWGRATAALWITSVWLSVAAVVVTKWFPDMGFNLE